MAACTFFGHRDCYGLDMAVLKCAIEKRIRKGVDTFYVGHQGQFDSMVLHCLRALKAEYPHIRFSVVLAYMPTCKPEYDPYADCSIYPEGLEETLPKFAIARRNKWMISKSTDCLCFIQHPWGGAYQFARTAKYSNLEVENLGIFKI